MHFEILCTTISLKKIYFSIVYSRLHYGITAWGGTAAKYQHKI